MGKATIIGGGTDGRYTVKMDYGKAVRDARLTVINKRLVEIDAATEAAQQDFNLEEIILAGLDDAADTAITDYVTATQAIGPAFTALKNATQAYQYKLSSSTATPAEKTAAKAAMTAAEANYKAVQGAVKPALDAQVKAALKLVEAKRKIAPLRLKIDVLKDEKTQLEKDKAYQTGLQLEGTLQAWCADFTEDGKGEVATIEIPGEDALVLIAPAAPAHTAGDGVLVAREAQSPEQAFFNAAILPGWQKFKPTYRRGIITKINDDGTADVDFTDDKSSAQNLGINRYPRLAGIPVKYMTCHAGAFEKDDKCVVKFTGQDWSFPTVVGFVDNPKRCGGFWVLVKAFTSKPGEPREHRSKLFRMDTTRSAAKAQLMHSGSGFIVENYNRTMVPGTEPPTDILGFVPYGKLSLVWTVYSQEWLPGPSYANSVTKMWWGVDSSIENEERRLYYFSPPNTPDDEGPLMFEHPAMLSPGEICFSTQEAQDNPLYFEGRPSLPGDKFLKIVVKGGQVSAEPVTDGVGAIRKYVGIRQTYWAPNLFRTYAPPAKSADQPAYTRREIGTDVQGYNFIYDGNTSTWFDRWMSPGSARTAVFPVDFALSSNLYLYHTNRKTLGIMRLKPAGQAGNDQFLGELDPAEFPDIANDPFFTDAIANDRVSYEIKFDPADLWTPGFNFN